MGKAHPCQETYYVAMGEHAAGKFDISCIEEAAEMPPEHYAGKMRKKHKVIHCLYSPQEDGTPVKRPRFMGAGLNRETLIWLGPDKEDVTNEVLAIFSRRPARDASIFALQDTAANVQVTRSKYGERLRANVGTFL